MAGIMPMTRIVQLNNSSLCFVTSNSFCIYEGMNSCFCHFALYLVSASSKEKEVDVFLRSRYVVVTHTSNSKGAGTKCGVYLILKGEVASHQLFMNNSGNEFKLGQNDTFQVSPTWDSSIIWYKVVGILTKWRCYASQIHKYFTYPMHVFLLGLHNITS